MFGENFTFCSVGSNSYRNITSGVAKMLGSDEKNDTAGLVKDVKDMPNKKGGEIEICRIPFFTAFKPRIWLLIFSEIESPAASSAARLIL